MRVEICNYVYYYSLYMISPAQKSRALKAAETCKRLSISQNDIAVAVGASQGQVSRILAANGSRASRLFEEVCLYIEKKDVGVTAEAVKDNAELIEALRATWDGSGAHARALANVIRSLSVLRK